MEMACELLAGWLAVEPTISLGLFVREEIDGHGDTPPCEAPDIDLARNYVFLTNADGCREAC